MPGGMLDRRKGSRKSSCPFFPCKKQRIKAKSLTGAIAVNEELCDLGHVSRDGRECKV